MLCRNGGGAEVFVMLTEKELISHAGDIIAHCHMPGLASRQLFMRHGHRAGRPQIILK